MMNNFLYNFSSFRFRLFDRLKSCFTLDPLLTKVSKCMLGHSCENLCIHSTHFFDLKSFASQYDFKNNLLSLSNFLPNALNHLELMEMKDHDM